MARKTGKNEEARQRSRDALLRAGADLLVEHATHKPFAALRLRSICAKADLSTGAFYLHWDNLDQYYQALVNYLIAGDKQIWTADFSALMELATAPAEASSLGAVARVADEDLRLLVANPFWDAVELMNLTLGRTQRYRESRAHAYQLIDQDTGRAYGAILEQLGREPRPPFGWDQIGTILQGLLEGLGLRYKIDPEAVSGSAEAPTGPYAIAAAAILAVLTQPIGDHKTVNEIIQGLLETPAQVPPASYPDEDIQDRATN